MKRRKTCNGGDDGLGFRVGGGDHGGGRDGVDGVSSLQVYDSKRKIRLKIHKEKYEDKVSVQLKKESP